MFGTVVVISIQPYGTTIYASSSDNFMLSLLSVKYEILKSGNKTCCLHSARHFSKRLSDPFAYVT